METAFPVAPAQPSFSVGGLIGRTFSTWSGNLVTFALLGAIVNAPVFVLGLWSQYAVYGGYPSFGQLMATAPTERHAAPFGGSPGVFAVIWLVTMVLTFVEMGALTFGAIQHLAGRPVSVGALVGVGFRRSLSVLGASVGSGLVIFLGTLLLVVPGIIALCAVIAAIPVVVAEKSGAWAAISRSFALTKGRRFRIFVALLVMALIAWTVSAIAAVLPLALGGGTASLVGAVVTFAVGAIVGPLWTLFPAVVYHDLRTEKEGVDAAELAKVFE